MTDDAELLCRYADNRSEAAFAELVARHVDLVYSAALRQGRGDHHRAQEVTQMVFTDLARKAAALVRHPVLPAWLHRSSHLATLDLLRRDGRRHRYERAAGAEAAITAPEGEAVVWEVVGPVLDEAINKLDERDRQAILLRYFGDRPFGEVGQRLKLSENAARMRVERALEKLRGLLARRGINSSSAALAAALSGNAIVAAPAGVAGASASAAMSVAGGAGVAWIAFMSTSKLPLALSAAVLLGGAAIVTVQDQAANKSARELANISHQNQSIPGLSEQNESLTSAAAQARKLTDDDASISVLQRQVNDLAARADAATAAAQRKANRATKLDESQPVFDISKLDQRPISVKLGRPEYPAEMARAGASGEALVDFVIGSDGLVYNAYAAASSDRAFEAAAVQAVSQWVFKPGLVGGQNVYTHMQVPIVFTLNPGEEAQPSSASWF
jgi:RNA polymerase sigma factor (sigma-70 family)